LFFGHLTNSAIFFFSLYWLTNRAVFFPKKRRTNCSPVCQIKFYVIALWNLRWVESSLTGLNCFRKVKCKNAIRTPVHFLNSASKSFKSHRWISRANNYLLNEAFSLVEEAAPIKWFGRAFFLFVHSRFWQIFKRHPF
jgi:hypothetical protein